MKINPTVASFLPAAISSVPQSKRTIAEYFSLGSDNALFQRGRNRMELTEAGRILVEYARRALHNLDRARAEISPFTGEVAGIVTVGLVPSLVNTLTSPVMARITVATRTDAGEMMSRMSAASAFWANAL